jgi:WD40 repeat protein
MSEQTMVTETYLKCQSGVACMSWASDETLVAGCTDHQLKVFDMNKLTVAESLFTNHKVVTCLDSTFDQQASILGGHEDGSVRLYDLRSSHSGGVKQHKLFEANTSFIS